jgi:hypothetical protein
MECIGCGAFAQVLRAKHIPTGVPVACKAIPKENIVDDAEFALLQREVSVMRVLDHPFCSPLYEVFEDAKYFFISMELLINGSLLDYINKTNGLSESEACRLFCQLVSVVEYLHLELRIAHRDLKPENILLDANQNIRVIDFGFSRAFAPNDPLLGTLCGSPAYMAPEVMQGLPYTSAADLWSMGILLFAMLTGSLPFGAWDESPANLVRIVLSSEPRMPSGASPDLQNLIARLLTKDPRVRISLKELRHHPWIAESEHGWVFKGDFLGKFRFAAPGELDPIIEVEMRHLSYDTTGLVAELKAGRFSERVAVYKMLRRAKMVDEIKEWQERVREQALRFTRRGSSVPRKPALKYDQRGPPVIRPIALMMGRGTAPSPTVHRCPMMPFPPGRC